MSFCKSRPPANLCCPALADVPELQPIPIRSRTCPCTPCPNPLPARAWHVAHKALADGETWGCPVLAVGKHAASRMLPGLCLRPGPGHSLAQHSNGLQWCKFTTDYRISLLSHGKTCSPRPHTRHDTCSLSTAVQVLHGEELTFDYACVTESEREFKAATCLCAGRGCRGSFLGFSGSRAFMQVCRVPGDASTCTNHW